MNGDGRHFADAFNGQLGETVLPDPNHVARAGSAVHRTAAEDVAVVALGQGGVEQSRDRGAAVVDQHEALAEPGERYGVLAVVPPVGDRRRSDNIAELDHVSYG